MTHAAAAAFTPVGLLAATAAAPLLLRGLGWLGIGLSIDTVAIVYDLASLAANVAAYGLLAFIVLRIGHGRG